VVKVGRNCKCKLKEQKSFKLVINTYNNRILDLVVILGICVGIMEEAQVGFNMIIDRTT
jgi:hypothetical protein